jgi:hypothetical protein
MRRFASYSFAPPILATGVVALLAACAFDTTFTCLFAGVVAFAALLMAVPLAMSLRDRLCWVGCALVLLTIAWVDWPLHLSYYLARPGLERLARDLRAGKTIPTPVRVGLVVIRGTELRRRVINYRGQPRDPTATDAKDIACLWTHPHPGGSGGFVQTPADFLQFNIWSLHHLDDRWQFITED